MPRRRLIATLVAGLVALTPAALPAATRASSASTAADAVSVVQTTVNLSQHLAAQAGLQFGAAAPAHGTPVVAINDKLRYQAVAGFGAAMTDSSAWLLEHSLSGSTRSILMDQLFTSAGIDLDFVRVPIGATDFTAGGVPYSYDDMPAGSSDPSLTHFSIAHDAAYILPALLQARDLDPGIEFMGTPWTPPAWMKGNDSLGNSRHRGTLLGSAYAPWAAYIVKFIQAYAQAGIQISALTPQNEPQNATPYPGLEFAQPSQANWIIQDLVPDLFRAHLSPRLYGGDLGWSTASIPYVTGSAGGEAARTLSGLAWHCYFGSPNVMSSMHARYWWLDEVVDECSPGISALPTADVVISSLRNWASTVALWNLALNPKGGPVQRPNVGCRGCYGLATINQQTGSVRLTNAYFQLGQASEFIHPGAVRIGSTNFVTYNYTRPGVDFVSQGLDDVAAVNPDGSHVLLAHNAASKPLAFAVKWNGRYFDYTLPAGATATFTWDRPAS